MRHAFRLSCRLLPVSGPTQPRVVLVTGASSGIGLCSAALFAARGWRVGLVSRSAEGLAAAARLIAQRSPDAMVACAVADVADSEALAAAARAVVAALGPIEVWVNAAGNGVYGHFRDVPEAEYRRVTEVTYHGTVNGSRIALSHMMPRGRTEVAAQGVWLCATGRGGELLLTGVVQAYSRIARLSPWLAGYLVSRSDFASEMPRDEARARDRVPCLFATRTGGHSMHGPFGARARGWSSQVWIAGIWGRLRGVSRDRPAAPSPPARAPAAPDRAPAGSAQPGRAASDSVR